MESPVRMGKERAKELLSEVDSSISRLQPDKVLQAVVKVLTGIPSYSWVGIYLRERNDLVLETWSGPQATVHVRIPIGKGICGWAAKSGRTEIVSDVTKDPRYLQCFASTKSEIVVPILREGTVIGEIDVDGETLNAYSSVDRDFLEAVARKIAPFCNKARP